MAGLIRCESATGTWGAEKTKCFKHLKRIRIKIKIKIKKKIKCADTHQYHTPRGRAGKLLTTAAETHSGQLPPRTLSAPMRPLDRANSASKPVDCAVRGSALEFSRAWWVDSPAARACPRRRPVLSARA